MSVGCYDANHCFARRAMRPSAFLDAIKTHSLLSALPYPLGHSA